MNKCHTVFSVIFTKLFADLASAVINNEDLQLLDEIGKGQFGCVKKGLWKGMQVAVKEILLGYEEPDLSEVNLCR